MYASSISSRLARFVAAAAVVLAGASALPDRAEARDRVFFSGGFNSWGGSSIGLGFSTGGGHWGRGGWGRRGWGGDHLSLGFTYVVPPAYYGPRPYDYPAYYGAAPYGYPTRPYYSSPGYYPVGGVVAFSTSVRERLSTRTRGVYYDAYRSALAAPIGEPINWRDGRVEGDVTTTRDGWAGERYCREFRQNIIVDGKTEEAYGTACRNAADTDWEIIPD